MRERLKDYLFSKRHLVHEERLEHTEGGEPIEVLVSLGKLFGIRVTARGELAQLAMVRVAARNIGQHVPEPFYRGFPNTVRELPIHALLLDQVLHYARTYGMQDFSQPGHSLFEYHFERLCFAQNTEVRDYDIVMEAEARDILERTAKTWLASTRPLSTDQFLVLVDVIQSYNLPVRSCACKDTISRLIIHTRDVAYAELFQLPDVIRFVETMQYETYGSKSIRKLNLRNRDRRLVCAVLDTLLASDPVGHLRTCMERRRDWCGLLHHVHYRPTSEYGRAFVNAMRGKKVRSAWSGFEGLVAAGDTRAATDLLAKEKGSGAVLRNLDYLLSRCQSDDDVAFVLDAAKSSSKIALVQMLMHYGAYVREGPRTFSFSKFGLLRTHCETSDEELRRRTRLAPEVVEMARSKMLGYLRDACKPVLGKVYAAPELKRMAVPLRMSTSSEGVGALPSGSRLPLPPGKKLRAFTYWELVDDIDLSAIGLTEKGEQYEFSWRTMSSLQGEAIAFSGDQTSGYNGGSEYFDIMLPTFREWFCDVRYLVFCDNVYSGSPFSACFCKAGYMLRDEVDSGEVFEPKTVESSFGITCASTSAYLFAIDLELREFVWLNIARGGSQRVAGASQLDFLLPYLHVTDVLSLYDLARLHASEMVENPEEADVVLDARDVSWAVGLLNQ